MEEKNFGYLGFSFQQSLIKAIIEDKKYGEVIIDVLETKFFDNSSFRFIIENIKELFSTYKKLPNYETIVQKILAENTNKDSSRIHIDTLDNIKNDDKDTSYVKDSALNFCKQQNLKKELKNVNYIIENGDFEDYHKIEEIIQNALQVGIVGDDTTDVFDDIDGTLEKDYRKPIPTGIVGVDNVLKGGLGKSELGVILAPTGVGKSLPISEPVLTPYGWVKMGELNVGDDVVGSDGNPQKVIGIYPQGERPIFKIQFTDQTFVYCDEEHLWSVNTNNMRTRKTRIKGKSVYEPNNEYVTIKTSDMIKNVRTKNRYNYRLPTIQPINFIEKEVTINPYLLGLLLGDGYLPNNDIVRISTKDDEMFDNIKHLSEHTSFNEYKRLNDNTIKVINFKSDIKNRLNNYGLLGKKSHNKFIPKEYLYNTFDIRIGVLQGLMDSDGYVDKRGLTQFSSVSKMLCDDVRELVLSLGGTVSYTKKTPKYKYNGIIKNGQLSYILTISFSNGIVPFKLSRKTIRFKKREKYINKKFIKTIEYSHNEEAVCIKVSNEDELFVTRDYVLTHNTTILTKMANSAYNHDYNVLQIFFEDNPGAIKRKHYTIWTGVEPDELSDNPDEIKSVIAEAQSMSRGKLKLLKYNSGTVSVNDIKAKIRKMNSDGFNLDLLVIDYVDCITTKGGDDGEEWKGEGNIMRALESMASEFNFALWTATQGSRNSISSEIVTSDQMGGSIKKAQIAHVIISVGKTLEQKEHDLATISILKSRIGKDGIIFQNCKFDNKLIKIDTESQNTLLGHKEETQQNKAKVAAEAYKRIQERKNNNI